MKFEDLKIKMSKLDETLAKTDSCRELYVCSSPTAQTKLLFKFRFMFIFFLVIGVVYGSLMISRMIPSCFPNYLNTAIELFTIFCSIWYIVLYYMLQKIDVATLSPMQLFDKVSMVRKLAKAGQLVIVLCFVVLDEFMWRNVDSVWIMCIPIGILIIYTLKSYWPNYENLFKSITRHE